ncbi:MAG: tRNA (N6-isopentenyl adenosine(37)-C2)-methylthiotransferase MiaB [Alphaproteobacteria bacterium]
MTLEQTPANTLEAKLELDPKLSNKKRLFIKTYGCQMNVYDSHRMADSLKTLGYDLTKTQEDADLIVLNTCHIREKAAEKVYSEIGRLKSLKKSGELMIAVAGCVAQAEGEEIIRRAPVVDMVFGPQSYHRLPELVAKAERKRSELLKDNKPMRSAKVIDTEFPEETKFDHLPEESAPQGPAAFLTVQEGCDKFCTFCVVPYTRGAEESRPVEQILREARQLVSKGTKEITLLGQNVNAYHGVGFDGKDWGLGRLIRHMAEIDGLERIRFTTSHPRDMQDDLYDAFANEPKLMPYFHLPVQAGSDKILQAMNRDHTAKSYMQVIERLRNARPDLALSGDFIVGFPGETDKDFADTLKLVTEVNYAQAYSFKYSPRPGTPAASSDLHVEEAVKSERLQSLQGLLNVQQEAFNEGSIGKTMPVLFERRGKQEGQLIGRSPYMQSVYVNAKDRVLGQILDCKVNEGGANSVRADLVLI